MPGFRTVSGRPFLRSERATERERLGEASADSISGEGPFLNPGDEGRTAATGDPGGRRMEGARRNDM